MIKSWLFEFFHQPLDEQLRSDPASGARSLPLVPRPVDTRRLAQLRGHLLQRAPLRRGLQPVTEPADLARRGPDESAAPRRARFGHVHMRRRGVSSRRSPCSIT